jgi:hypothetical protein
MHIYLFDTPSMGMTMRIGPDTFSGFDKAVIGRDRRVQSFVDFAPSSTHAHSISCDTM